MKITIRPTNKQHKAYIDLNDEVIKFIFFGGGAGGGKSWLGCEWLLQMCYLYPGSKWFIGRSELKRLMASSFVTWLKVCAHHQIPKDDWKLNGQYNYVEFENGSRIDFLDLAFKPTDPFYERLGSLEYTGGWIEEGGEIHFKAFDVLKTRIGRHKNKDYNLKPKLLVTCNPKKNWIYSKVYKKYREGALTANYSFIQSLYKDNPHTAKEYEEMLDEVDDQVTIQRLKYGNWEYDGDARGMILYDSICDLFSIKNKETENKYIIIDVARDGKDKATVSLWYGFQLKKWEVYPKSKINVLQDNVRILANNEGVTKDCVLADEGGVGGGFVDNYGCKGFVGNSRAIKRPEDKKNKLKVLNYDSLKAQCADLLARKINNSEIGIDATDFEEEIKEELEMLKRRDLDKEGTFKIATKDETKNDLGRSPDFMDNMIMRMYFELLPFNTKTENEDESAGEDFLKELASMGNGFNF